MITIREDNERDLLLVDDDPTLCWVLAKALRSRGFTVPIANNVDAAVQAARGQPPHYGIIDLKMPGFGAHADPDI